MTTPISTEFLALQEVLAGRYSIERELGRGGMGIVLLARDVALDRPVAIKLLPPQLAADPDARDRFLQEARTAAGLAHPNIIPIHLVEAHGALVYFVMGYVDGETLRERVERSGPLTPRLAMKLLQEVAWALGYAHQRGVIHRDVKPDNIMVERATDRALVADFGIALGANAGGGSGGGPVIGTARYMSPEQACGEPVDARSDLYSLAATFFFALTGRAPFEGSNLP
ncbi:MAG TPA: serine/threonine-protein kinase, partial [Gemmatimonadales bacterium]